MMCGEPIIAHTLNIRTTAEARCAPYSFAPSNGTSTAYSFNDRVRAPTSSTRFWCQIRNLLHLRNRAEVVSWLSRRLGSKSCRQESNTSGDEGISCDPG